MIRIKTMFSQNTDSLITDGLVEMGDYRFERKFSAYNYSALDLENIVKMNSANFSEIFYERVINNIYLDSPELELFRANYDGNSQRMKIRVRWYGDMFGDVSSPVLEIKVRTGQLNRKESYPINSFKLEKGYSSDLIISTLCDSDIPILLKHRIKTLIPVLLNQYTRKYFLSFDGNFRITIDKGLMFYKIHRFNNFFVNKLSQEMYSILELKYNPEYDNFANRISTRFPFRLTKSSKYMLGMSNIYKLLCF